MDSDTRAAIKEIGDFCRSLNKLLVGLIGEAPDQKENSADGIPDRLTFTKRQVAEALGVSERTVDRYRELGTLNEIGLPGEALRFRRDEVVALAHSKRKKKK